MEIQLHEVGGKIRDEIMGLKSKDVDYTVVCDNVLNLSAEEAFKTIHNQLKDDGFEIFLVTPDCYTIRALFPKGHFYSGVADFVMARKEIGYIENTRKPIVQPGTLFDDLERRDFTVNAIAKMVDGTYYDPFNGIGDIENNILRTPLDPLVTFNDDPLRILRAIRFHITKGFDIHFDILDVMKNYDYNEKFKVVSHERIRDELYKCFKFDTLKTIKFLIQYESLMEYCFKNGYWLKPTNEQ
jgi:tRNA nucleotidyltransferase/poly(A) polymerase